MKKTTILIFLSIVLLFENVYAINFFKKLEREAKRIIGDKKDETQNSPPPPATVDTTVLNAGGDTIAGNTAQTDSDKSGSLLKIGEKFGLNEKTAGMIDAGFGLIKSRQEITPDEEVEIGGSLIIEIIDRYGGKYNNSQIQKYVNLVGRTVYRYADAGDIDFRFMVLNSDEINAFAAPGGFVFITKGLYFMLENEAQLAGVLAHEIGHITHKHMIKTLQRAKMFMSLTRLTALAAKKDVGKYSKVMTEVNSTLFEKGVDQEFEYEADVQALQYSSAAGYNPYAYAVFLTNLEKLIGTKKSIFFSTHPNIDSRIKISSSELSAKFSDSGAILKERFINYTYTNLQTPKLKKSKFKYKKN